MTATLELPVSVAISALRNVGTGDNLLNALDALVNMNCEEVQTNEIDSEPAEWVNMVNLDADEVTEETVTL